MKWVSRALLLTGIAVSAVSFSHWYYSVAVSIILVALQQFIERALFTYTTMYIQPFPDFNWKPAEWAGMAYAFPEPPGPTKPNLFGPLFKTQEYAEKVFELIRAWNEGRDEDDQQNICISIILESDAHYSVFIYPNPNSARVGAFFKHAEHKLRFEKFGKKHHGHIAMMTLSKMFPYAPNTKTEQFLDSYSESKPNWLQAFIQRPDGKFEILFDIKPIVVWKIKIRNRRDLDRTDWEYVYLGERNKPRSFPKE